MLFQGMVPPAFSLHFELLANAFNPHHLPMAFFFGVLGFFFGCTTVYFLSALLKEKKVLASRISCCKIIDERGFLDTRLEDK